MAKYDNIVIGAQYFENLCLPAYEKLLNQLQITDDKSTNIDSRQCEQEFKKRSLELLKTKGNGTSTTST